MQWALSNQLQKNAAAKAEEGDGGVAVTTQPQKKEPEGIREKTKANVEVSWMAVVCSVICLCTLPALLCALPAAVVATVVRSCMI